MTLGAPEPLDRQRHLTDRFDCGRPQLDAWLKASAGQAQRRDAGRTFVVARSDGSIAGFYTLVAGQVDVEQATDAVRRGMSRHFPIPVVILARLAVARSAQGEGLGRALLADASRRAVRAADDVGIRAVIVDALDDHAAAFYGRFGFAALPGDARRLMATVAQLRAARDAK